MSSFYQAPWPCRYLVDNGTSFRTRRKSRALHFTMTEIVEQRICVKFCKEFGHYCSESIGATRKVTGAIVNGDRNDFALYKLRKLQGKDRQRCGISQSYTRRHENYLWNDLILWSNVVSHWTQRSTRLHRCRFSRIRSVPCREGLNRLFLSALCFALLCFPFFLSFFPFTVRFFEAQTERNHSVGQTLLLRLRENSLQRFRYTFHSLVVPSAISQSLHQISSRFCFTCQFETHRF